MHKSKLPMQKVEAERSAALQFGVAKALELSRRSNYVIFGELGFIFFSFSVLLFLEFFVKVKFEFLNSKIFGIFPRFLANVVELSHNFDTLTMRVFELYYFCLISCFLILIPLVLIISTFDALYSRVDAIVDQSYVKKYRNIKEKLFITFVFLFYLFTSDKRTTSVIGYFYGNGIIIAFDTLMVVVVLLLIYFLNFIHWTIRRFGKMNQEKSCKTSDHNEAG